MHAAISQNRRGYIIVGQTIDSVKYYFFTVGMHDVGICNMGNCATKYKENVAVFEIFSIVVLGDASASVHKLV